MILYSVVSPVVFAKLQYFHEHAELIYFNLMHVAVPKRSFSQETPTDRIRSSRANRSLAQADDIRVNGNFYPVS